MKARAVLASVALFTRCAITIAQTPMAQPQTSANDADFVVGGGLIGALLGHRAERRERDHRNEQHPAGDAHAQHLVVAPNEVGSLRSKGS